MLPHTSEQSSESSDHGLIPEKTSAITGHSSKTDNFALPLPKQKADKYNQCLVSLFEDYACKIKLGKLAFSQYWVRASEILKHGWWGELADGLWLKIGLSFFISYVSADKTLLTIEQLFIPMLCSSCSCPWSHSFVLHPDLALWDDGGILNAGKHCCCTPKNTGSISVKKFRHLHFSSLFITL